MGYLHQWWPCSVGQWAPEGLGVCGTVLEPTAQALEQCFFPVEDICDVTGQLLQKSKFKRDHFVLLFIPAGQQILVEGDTICEIFWIPIIIQEAVPFHVGYKAT